MGKFDSMGAEAEEADERETPTVAQAAAAVAAKALEERDIRMLRDAFAMDPGWVATPWKEPKRGLGTLPLPCAARAGWAQGIEELVKMGADPRLADEDRQGFARAGRPPLAEALSKRHWSSARALVDAGAVLEPLSQMAWAAGFVASWHGPAEGVAALDWMKREGFDLWTDDAVAKRAQSMFLFCGGIKSGTLDERNAWGEAIFEGADISKEGARACLWSYAFGAATSCKDLGEGLAGRWMDADPTAAGSLLSWALEYGCPRMARAAAARMAVSKAAPGGNESWHILAKACAARHPQGTLPVEGAKAGELGAAAFLAAWESLGSAWAARPEIMSKAARNAMGAGNAGLLEGLVFQAGVDASATLESWAKGGPQFGETESGVQGALRVAMAGAIDALGDEGASALFESLHLRRWARKPEAFDLLESQARSFLVARSARAPSKPRSTSQRM